MTQPRATRLNKPYASKSGFLTKWFPRGTLMRKIVMGVVFPFLALLILGAITDRIVMPIVTRQGSALPLPDFSGQRLTEAQISLKELDLSYAIAAQEYSPGRPEGEILGQYPVAGTKVKPGRDIRFVVSLGQKQVPIPDVAGMSVRQAKLHLESSRLKLGEIAWAFSDTIPEKVVVFSFPVSGTDVPIGTNVNLMVNRGRASHFTFMPLVIGLTIDEATRRIEDKSLKVGIVSYRTDENYLPETVLEQSESEGTELDVNTEIDLVVSSTE